MLTNKNLPDLYDLSHSNIGFDIGGVICPHDNNTENKLPSPNTHIVDLMRHLVENKNELFIISFLGKNKVQEQLAWLYDHQIVPSLVPLTNVYLHGDDKRAKFAIAKHLNLHHFIDDSTDVIDMMRTGRSKDDNKFLKKLKGLSGQIGSMAKIFKVNTELEYIIR